MKPSVLRAQRRVEWAAHSYALSPGRVRLRLSDRRAPKVLCVSVPKSGTFLLERALCLHPRLYRKLARTVWASRVDGPESLIRIVRRLRPGSLILSHVGFDPSYPGILRRHGVTCVFLVRDPRDVAVSHAHYAASNRRHWLHDVYRATPSFGDRLRISIAGHPSGLVSLGDTLRASEGWLDAADVVVRFEDLVGSAGGGDDDRQRATIGGLYAVLGLEADDALLTAVQERLFSPTSITFRRGLIGQWRNELDPRNEELLREVAGEMLVRFGYGSSAGEV